MDRHALQETEAELAAKRHHLNSELVGRLSTLQAALAKEKAAETSSQQELAVLQEQRRERAARANELISKRETLRRLEESVGRGDLAAELRQIEEEISACSQWVAQQAVRTAEAVKQVGRIELQRGIAHLQCRAVESENSEKKELLEHLNRYRYWFRIG